jgi:hypothetical protein
MDISVYTVQFLIEVLWTHSSIYTACRYTNMLSHLLTSAEQVGVVVSL